MWLQYCTIFYMRPCPIYNCGLASVPDSKVHGANVEPIEADRTQLGPMMAP